MSNSVRNGIIWVGLSVPQGDKGGGSPNKNKGGEVGKKSPVTYLIKRKGVIIGLSGGDRDAIYHSYQKDT